MQARLNILYFRKKMVKNFISADTTGALTLLLLLSLLSGCIQTHPLLKPDVRENLRQAVPLDQKQLIEKPVIKLETVPIEPGEEIFNRAKSVVAPSPALPSKAMSLQDIRKVVLDNNLGLKSELFNPSIAQQGYMAERAKFEAVLSAAASFAKENDASGDPSDTVNLLPSIRVPTRTGGEMTLGLPYTHLDSEAVDPFTGAALGENTTTGINLLLDQPLLRNSGIKANQASIDIAGLQMRQADSRMKLSAVQLLANAEQNYWRYYASHENLKIQIKQYELAKEQLRMAQRMVEEGVRTKVEVTRAASGVARQFESIIIAENLRRRNERELKRIMNMADLPIDSDTIIQPSTLPRLEGLFFNRRKVVNLAYANRMDLFENELQQAIDRITVFANKNTTLPGLNLNFAYSYSGSQPHFSDAIDQMFETALNKFSVGLTAELPLQGNRAALARLRQSILRQKQTLANRQNLEQAVEQEVLNAIDALEQGWQRILSNRQAVALAAETYEEEKVQFQHGFVTSTDVLLALTSLSEAASAQVQAISEHQTALVDVAFATGTVLGYSDILWNPAPSPPADQTSPMSGFDYYK